MDPPPLVPDTLADGPPSEAFLPATLAGGAAPPAFRQGGFVAADRPTPKPLPPIASGREAAVFFAQRAPPAPIVPAGSSSSSRTSVPGVRSGSEWTSAPPGPTLCIIPGSVRARSHRRVRRSSLRCLDRLAPPRRQDRNFLKRRPLFFPPHYAET